MQIISRLPHQETRAAANNHGISGCWHIGPFFSNGLDGRSPRPPIPGASCMSLSLCRSRCLPRSFNCRRGQACIPVSNPHGRDFKLRAGHIQASRRAGVKIGGGERPLCRTVPYLTLPSLGHGKQDEYMKNRGTISLRCQGPPFCAQEGAATFGLRDGISQLYAKAAYLAVYLFVELPPRFPDKSHSSSPGPPGKPIRRATRP